MRRKTALLAAVLAALLLPAPALAQTVSEGLIEVVGTLDLDALAAAAEDVPWLEDGVEQVITRLASGQAALTADEALRWLMDEAAGVLRRSVWRITRLLVPALLVAAAELIAAPGKAAGKAARYAGLIMTMAFLVVDLREHVALAEESVGRMSEMMQAIFPLMVTLLAAVGGTASSAFYQPAVMAAAGSMTTLISHVTLPFAVSVAVLTMVGSLSDGLRISRLRRLLRQVAEWTLGFGFTVFIGVMTVQGVSAAAVDGVSIRTAKYAMDNFIPIVGGMFADTVDTLVGCSLIVQNAVGALGLILLLGALAAPLLRTVVTMFLYRAASALLQPIGDSPLARGMGDYAEVFSLLFIIQLSVGAMFLLLVAQLLTVANLTVMLR